MVTVSLLLEERRGGGAGNRKHKFYVNLKTIVEVAIWLANMEVGFQIVLNQWTGGPDWGKREALHIPRARRTVDMGSGRLVSPRQKVEYACRMRRLTAKMAGSSRPGRPKSGGGPGRKQETGGGIPGNCFQTSQCMNPTWKPPV